MIRLVGRYLRQRISDMFKMFAVTRVILLLAEYSSHEVTGAMVARELKHLGSRSSVYRWLSKAEGLGLVYRWSKYDVRFWAVTDKGAGFVREWDDLPF